MCSGCTKNSAAIVDAASSRQTLNLEALLSYGRFMERFADMAACKRKCDRGLCSKAADVWVCVVPCTSTLDCPAGLLCNCIDVRDRRCTWQRPRDNQNICLPLLNPIREIRISGDGLTSEQVRHELMRRQNDIKYCFEQAVARRPKTAGKIALQFSVSSNGRVVSPSVASSTLHDGLTETCVSDASRAWTFPQPGRAEGVSVVAWFELPQATE